MTCNRVPNSCFYAEVNVCTDKPNCYPDEVAQLNTVGAAVWQCSLLPHSASTSKSLI